MRVLFFNLSEESLFLCEYEGVNDVVQFFQLFRVAENQCGECLAADAAGRFQDFGAKGFDRCRFRGALRFQQAVSNLIGLQDVAAQFRQNGSNETLARCEPPC